MFLSSWLRTSFVLLHLFLGLTEPLCPKSIARKEKRPTDIPLCPENVDKKEERPADIPLCPEYVDKKEERPADIPLCPECVDKKEDIMRIMGLDYGSKTVGVAVSDPLGITAQGVETITREEENKLRKTCARIEELIGQYEIETIVLGYPKNMNNTAGDRAKKTEAFKEMLERRTSLPVVLWDERLTTAASERILMESGVRRENRKAVIDKVAAGLILQGYLDSLKQETNNDQ